MKIPCDGMSIPKTLSGSASGEILALPVRWRGLPGLTGVDLLPEE